MLHSADDDAAARRPGCCCCRGAALRLAGRAAGPHACRARLGGSRVAGGCGKPVRRCGGGKSPATEGALSEDPHSGQVVRAERLGGRRRPAAGIRGRSGYPTDRRTGRAPTLSRRPAYKTRSRRTKTALFVGKPRYRQSQPTEFLATPWGTHNSHAEDDERNAKASLSNADTTFANPLIIDQIDRSYLR